MTLYVPCIPLLNIVHIIITRTLGGGIAIYLNESFKANRFDNLIIQLPNLESLFLEIVQPQKFIIGMIYRPPNANIDAFLYLLLIMLQ